MIKDVWLLIGLKKEENKGDVELTLSQNKQTNNCLKTDKYIRGGAGGTAGTALAGPLFMAIRPHPQLNFCGLDLESTLSFVRVFTFYQNKSILLENNGSH